MPYEIVPPEESAQPSSRYDVIAPEAHVEEARKAPHLADVVKKLPKSEQQLLYPGMDFSRKPSETGRQIVRTVARAGESLAGLPGDIIQGVSSLANIGLRAATGKGFETLEDIPYLPTSEKIKKYISDPLGEFLGGEKFLDPKGKYEQLADELVGDLSVFLLPVKGKIPFARALKTAGLGNLAKFASKEAGLPEGAQEAVKIGTMLGVNLASPRKLLKNAKQYLSAATESLPEGAEVASKSFEPVLERLFKLRTKGDIPSTWNEKLKYLSDQIVAGKVPVQDVWDLSKDINNLFYGAKKPSAFKRSFNFLKDGLSKTLAEYGKENPSFYKNLTAGNDLYSAVSKAEKATGFLNKTLKNKKALGASTLGALFGWYSPAQLVKYGGGAYLANEAVKTFNILKNSSTARKYYLDTFKSAIGGYSKQASKSAKKLDEYLKKSGAN